jgi:cell division protein FtsB
MRGLYYTLAVSLLCAFAFVTLRGPRVIPDLFATWSEIRALEKSNAELKREVDQRRDRVKALQEDPVELEPEFRRLLEMQKKGEVDFKLHAAPPASGKK